MSKINSLFTFSKQQVFPVQNRTTYK